MSIIGVYMPCTDFSLDCYSEHLVELERVISGSESLGPVVVMGDFNAHLSENSMNVQGVLLREMMDRGKLCDASSGCLAEGPDFTYSSGVVRTKVDYALMNVEAVTLLSSSVTREMEDLNTSDHLPIIVYLSNVSLNLKSEGEVLGRRVLWDRVDDDSKEEYISEVQMLIEPLLNGCYSDVHELGKEIELVSKSLVECGLNTLPLINGKKKRVWKDKQLSDL